MIENKIIKYTKKDFLDYAEAFDYELDEVKDKNGKILTDDAIKKQMESWSLKEFHDWFDFSHKNSWTGDEIRK